MGNEWALYLCELRWFHIYLGISIFFLFLGKPLDTSSELTPRPKTLEMSIQ